MKRLRTRTFGRRSASFQQNIAAPRAQIDNTAISKIIAPQQTKSNANKSPPSPPQTKFTTRQLMFMDAYLADPKKNATAAAIKAGYAEKTAYAQGSALLKHLEVSREITARMRKAAAPTLEQFEINEYTTMQAVASIAFSDIGNFLDDAGHLINPKSLPAHFRTAVAKFSRDYIRYDATEKRHVIRETIHFWNKNDALEKIMIRLGLLNGDGPPVDSGSILVRLLAEVDAHERLRRQARTIEHVAGEGDNA